MDRLSRDIQAGVSYCPGFFENAEGLRRIKVDKKCVGIAEDFEGYRFPEAKEGKGISNNLSRTVTLNTAAMRSDILS